MTHARRHGIRTPLTCKSGVATLLRQINTCYPSLYVIPGICGFILQGGRPAASNGCRTGAASPSRRAGRRRRHRCPKPPPTPRTTRAPHIRMPHHSVMAESSCTQPAHECTRDVNPVRTWIMDATDANPCMCVGARPALHARSGWACERAHAGSVRPTEPNDEGAGGACDQCIASWLPRVGMRP